MCCSISPPATLELSGSGKADDGSTGAIHESAAAVGAEAGLDSAVAGESFGATARGFQQSAANVIVREGVRFAGAGPVEAANQRCPGDRGGGTALKKAALSHQVETMCAQYMFRMSWGQCGSRSPCSLRISLTNRINSTWARRCPVIERT